MLLVIILASCDYNAGDARRFEPRGNAPWPNPCAPFNVAILIDRSASIGDTSNPGTNWEQVQAVKQGVNGVNFNGLWVDGLLDHLSRSNARVWIGSFATLAKQHYPSNPNDKGYYPMNNPSNFAKAKAAVTNMQFGGTQRDWTLNQWTTSYDDYPDDSTDGASGRGRTNWQGAIDAPPGIPHLTIVLTDGDPTMYNKRGGVVSGDDPTEGDVNAAVNQANGNKLFGGRVIAVHFGAKNAGGPFGDWEQRLERISGPVSGIDYYPTTFTGLRSTLARDYSCTVATKTTLKAQQTTVAPGKNIVLTYTLQNTGNQVLTKTRVADHTRDWSHSFSPTEIDPGASRAWTSTFAAPPNPGTYRYRAVGCGTGPPGSGAEVCSQSAEVVITVVPGAPAPRTFLPV
jgi:hypothetical protein